MSKPKPLRGGEAPEEPARSPHEEILVFLKFPKPGRVKTRLAAYLGPEEAAAVFSRMARRSVETVVGTCSKRRRCVVLFDPPDHFQPIARWLEDVASAPRLSFEPQADGDLGARLDVAFRRAFERGARRVIAVGADCPALASDLLDRAFDLLEEHDAVLGPARDGGYYLLGLTHYCSAPFERVAWSSAKTAQMTRARFDEASLSYGELPLLEDLDTADDFERQRHLFPWLADPSA